MDSLPNELCLMIVRKISSPATIHLLRTTNWRMAAMAHLAGHPVATCNSLRIKYGIWPAHINFEARVVEHDGTGRVIKRFVRSRNHNEILREVLAENPPSYKITLDTCGMVDNETIDVLTEHAKSSHVVHFNWCVAHYDCEHFDHLRVKVKNLRARYNRE